MLFDTHCHPYYAQKKSQNEILERFFLWENRYLISVWVDIESSGKSIEIAKNCTNAYASIGIHPVDALKYRNNREKILTELEELYLKNKEYIVAIWESGLDYYWIQSLCSEYDLSTKEVQNVQEYFF